MYIALNESTTVDDGGHQNGKLFCLHTVPLKNVPPLNCYNLDIHNPITISFNRSVRENSIRNQTVLCFRTSPIQCFSITLQKRKPRRQRTGSMCMQHGAIATALLTPFLLNHAPNSPELNASITRFRESYSSVSMTKKVEEIKQQLVEFWQCSNKAFEWKCNFRVSLFCQVAQKHKSFDWGGILASFGWLFTLSVTFLPKKNTEIRSRVSKVIASQRWDIFWDTVQKTQALKTLARRTAVHS